MDDIELIQAFVGETQESIDDIEPTLIELQKQAGTDTPLDTETINAIFRVFHSTKGSAGFLQLTTICKITHQAETLLDLLRKGKLTLQENHMSLMMESCDFIRSLLGEIEEFGTDKGRDDERGDLVQRLKQCMQEDTAPTEEADKPAEVESKQAVTPVENTPPPAVPIASAEVSELASPEMIEVFTQDAEELLETAEQSLLQLSKSPEEPREAIHEALRALHTFKGNSGLLGLTQFEHLSHRMETIMQCIRDEELEISESILKILLSIIDLFRKCTANLAQGKPLELQGYMGLYELLGEFIPVTTSQPESTPVPPQPSVQAPEPPVQKPAAPPIKPPKKTQEKKAERSTGSTKTMRRDIRVNVEKLDLLHNLVGELIIAEAMVTRNNEVKNLRLEKFERASHHLSLITNELQDVAMSLRMIPLAGVFRKMIRLVHDLSSKAGKKIDLQLVGENTEVDRNVVELISDPLVHMIRNSVDHGLESPDERRQIGKSETGVLVVEAKHQSGEIWILVKDDGRGLNREKILDRAIERGLYEGDRTKIRDEEVFHFVFMPGFSTAETITDISGRGVGMDVVKKNIEKLKGHIDIESKPGQGSTFTIRIPLTLAIIQGMLLQVNDERYVIPLLSIRESLRPEENAISTVTGRGEVISIRGELLPLFRLSNLFHIPNAVTNPTEGIVVIIEDGTEHTALLVDELLGQQQVVIKSLDNVGVNVEGVSGACILNDGRVGLILDVRGMMRLATSTVSSSL